MCVCACACMCACTCIYSWRPEEGVRSPGAGLTGVYKSPVVGAENQTQVLRKSVFNYWSIFSAFGHFYIYASWVFIQVICSSRGNTWHLPPTLHSSASVLWLLDTDSLFSGTPSPQWVTAGPHINKWTCLVLYREECYPCLLNKMKGSWSCCRFVIINTIIMNFHNTNKIWGNTEVKCVSSLIQLLKGKAVMTAKAHQLLIATQRHMDNIDISLFGTSQVWKQSQWLSSDE